MESTEVWRPRGREQLLTVTDSSCGRNEVPLVEREVQRELSEAGLCLGFEAEGLDLSQRQREPGRGRSALPEGMTAAAG